MVGMPEASLERKSLPIYYFTTSTGEVLKFQIQGGDALKEYFTGQLLNPNLVRASRKKELEYFDGTEVRKLRGVEEARRRWVKPPITVRWVDVSKVDGHFPNVRSRLVARQGRQAGEEAICATTTSFEALCSVISLAAIDLPG